MGTVLILAEKKAVLSLQFGGREDKGERRKVLVLLIVIPVKEGRVGRY